MSWTLVAGPVDARAGIPEGEGVGNFDGDVYRFLIHSDSDASEKSVFVRFRGTLLAEDRSKYAAQVRDAVDSKGKREVERRLEGASIPRCITFSSGRATPHEDDECPNPLMET